MCEAANLANFCCSERIAFNIEYNVAGDPQSGVREKYPRVYNTFFKPLTFSTARSENVVDLPANYQKLREKFKLNFFNTTNRTQIVEFAATNVDTALKNNINLHAEKRLERFFNHLIVMHPKELTIADAEESVKYVLNEPIEDGAPDPQLHPIIAKEMSQIWNLEDDDAHADFFRQIKLYWCYLVAFFHRLQEYFKATVCEPSKQYRSINADRSIFGSISTHYVCC